MDTVLAKRRRSAAIARASKIGMKRRPGPQATESIKPDEMYPLRLVPMKFGIGRSTIRNAEKGGMKVKKLGLGKFVSGAELIRFINKQ